MTSSFAYLTALSSDSIFLRYSMFSVSSTDVEEIDLSTVSSLGRSLIYVLLYEVLLSESLLLRFESMFDVFLS